MAKEELTLEELLEQVKELFDINDIESNNKIIEMIDNYLSSIPASKTRDIIKSTESSLNILQAFNIIENTTNEIETKKIVKILTILRKRAEINLLELELENTTDQKEVIHLQGNIIKELKQLEKMEPDQNKKYEARHKRKVYLKKQKESTKDYSTNNENLSLSEKVYYKIKSISDGINAFLIEKDVIAKLGRILKDVASGSLVSALMLSAFGILSSKVIGIPFRIEALKNVLPLTIYTAIYSSLKNFGGKTGFEQYEYYQSDEYKEYLEKFKEENKELLLDIDKLTKEKNEDISLEENININLQLIEKLDEVVSSTKVQGLKDAYALPALELLRECKKNCKELINEYLDEENDDREKYVQYSKLLREINKKIFVRENSLKDALKYAGKNILNNSVIMIIAKILITIIAPASSVAISGIQSLILPLLYGIINGLIDITTYTNKLKYEETSDNVKVDPKDDILFKNLFKQSPSFAMA